LNINQRFVYVGIGGTGLLIGRELERSMRREICGPDGRTLKDNGGLFAELEPFELPSFFQTLYVDYDQSAVKAQQQMLSPSSAVVDATATFVTSLNPSVPSYSDAAKHLRNKQPDIIRPWLPGSSGEPAIAPLSMGAGQFPTVGRAAFFNVLEDHGTTALFNEIDRPLKRIAASMGELQAKVTGGGSAITDVTIYVGFSIAGGTGTGLFMDMIHLLSHRAAEVLGGGVSVRIIPLVVMPSVYENAMNEQKRRASKLNSARALIDLQQFIDGQNTAAADEKFSIEYPTGLSIEVPPATTPVAFTFGGASVLEPEEMFRSIGQGIIAQVSTTVVADQHAQGSPSMSWLADLVNKDPIFGVMHPSGIGRRPFAASLTASLTMPSEGISDALTRRLVASAFDQYLNDPLTGFTKGSESVTGAVHAAGLKKVFDGPLLGRTPVADLDGLKGHEEVNAALLEFKKQWQRALGSLPQRASSEIADIAVFDWKEPYVQASEMDGGNPVLGARVMLGYSAASDDAMRRGQVGYLESLGSKARALPKPTSTVGKKTFGKVKGTSPEVQQAVSSIEKWGDTRAKQIWADEWQAKHALWRPVLSSMDRHINRIVQDLRDLSSQDLADSAHALTAAQDSGIVIRSVLLADVAPHQLYQDLLRRIALEAGTQSFDEADLMTFLLARANYSWARFIATIVDGGYDTSAAWRELNAELRTVVENLLMTPATDLDEAILPRLSSVLAEAAEGTPDSSAVVDKVTAAITGMIPDGVAPRGDGTPEILVTYPSPDRNEDIEEFLIARINGDDGLSTLLKRGEAILRLQHAPDGDAITLTASIFGQGLLDSPEAASLLRFWLDTLPELKSGDKVAWRQRLSYSDLGRIARPHDRTVILQRILGAAFDGKVVHEVATVDAPERIVISTGEPGATQITFDLPEFLEDVSPLGWLPYAFEDMAVRMNSGERDIVEWLNSYTPDAMRTGSIRNANPGVLFLELLADTDREVKELKRALETGRLGVGGRRRVELYLDFWENLLPAAISQPYGGEGEMDAIVFGTLCDLCAALGIDCIDCGPMFTTRNA